MTRSKQGDKVEDVEVKSRAGIAFLLYTFGAMIYMIGFPSEYFIINSDTNLRQGLWVVCNSTTNVCTSIGSQYGWLAGARAFLTTGVVGLIVCMALMAMYIGTPGVMSRKTNITLLFALTIITVIIQLIGIIIYGASTTGVGSASWAYLLIIVGTIIYFIAAVLTGLETCAPAKKSRSDD